MYKYLAISGNVQEMMVMLKSLPICTIVFDQVAMLVDMNQRALDFFGIQNIGDYRMKKWIVLNNQKDLQRSIEKLKTGNVIRDKSQIVKCPDYSFSIVNFSACMLSGVSKVYIFQFFKLSTSSDSSLKSLNNVPQFNIENLSRNDSVKQNSEFQRFSIIQELKQQLFEPSANVDKIQTISNSISKKYPNFSTSEVFICTLIALSVPTSEIAIITNRKVSYVYAVIYKLLKVNNLNFRRELYTKLTEEYINL